MFNEGEEGTSWYIILKGSVNVVVHGKVRRTKIASLTAPTFKTLLNYLILRCIELMAGWKEMWYVIILVEV